MAATPSVALAYIVDARNRPRYADKVRDCCERHLKQITFGRGKYGWDGAVPSMCAAFNCILALDIVYDDLKPGQIAACEAVIESQMKKVRRNSPSWPAARLGTYGTWDIFKGQMNGPDDRYFKILMEPAF